MEELENFNFKLLFTVFDKLPLHSLLYVGCNIDNAFEDNFLLELKSKSLENRDYKNYYFYCFELSVEIITYLREQFIKYDGIILYFCHYAIMWNDLILLKVYDNDIFVIDKSLHISNDLIQECKAHGLMIYIEDNIDL